MPAVVGASEAKARAVRGAEAGVAVTVVVAVARAVARAAVGTLRDAVRFCDVLAPLLHAHLF